MRVSRGGNRTAAGEFVGDETVVPPVQPFGPRIVPVFEGEQEADEGFHLGVVGLTETPAVLVDVLEHGEYSPVHVVPGHVDVAFEAFRRRAEELPVPDAHRLVP